MAKGDWSETLTFIIRPPDWPPSISFDTANGSALPAGILYTTNTNWTFAGTASDPEGRLNRIEWRCSGDGCGSTASHSGTTSWSHTQSGMYGLNDVYFMAYDTYPNNTPSRHLKLGIDLAAPTTLASLNGLTGATQWPQWFTGTVAVGLAATDGATGGAVVGVQDVHYRLDTGSWQTVVGSSASFAVTADGVHTVDYYAVDKLGNQEGTRTVTFQIDATPPTWPVVVTETHGIASDAWQNSGNIATFSWAASTDAVSGVNRYQFYFGDDPGGISYIEFTAAQAREWTPLLNGVRTGTYYWRGRVRDNAGNWSNWQTLFIFRYDGTPPENPSVVTPTAAITSTVWQNITRVPDFAWNVPHDEGSGVKGYHVYWGLDPEGVTNTLQIANVYASATPLCGAQAACTGYLRLRSVDNVDNLANEWSTGFVMRYDNAPPTVDFTFAGGVTETAQTQLVLNINASDLGSGVRAMRFSNDNQIWTAWEAIDTQKVWYIPGISRQSWPVYVQVQDGVGLVSPAAAHAIYLDVNPKQPHSDSFRLFNRGLSVGAGGYNSSQYQGRGTLGQTSSAPKVQSQNFSLLPGYEAGAQALPLIEPGYETFRFINGLFASHGGATTVASTQFVMQVALGEVALPVTPTIASVGFHLQPGFLAAAPTPISLTIPVNMPGPAPLPEPAVTCETPSLQINNGEAFTNDLDVTLALCAPRAVEMKIGTDEALTGASWEPYATTRAWHLTAAGQFVQPVFVYAAFKEAGDTIQDTYFDDIIYDPQQPQGALLIENGATSSPAVSGLSMAEAAVPAVLGVEDSGAVDLLVNAQDDNSGLALMQISTNAAFTDTTWEPFSPVKTFIPPGGDGITTVYAQFQDSASNVSEVSSLTFVYDSQPPYGGLYFEPGIVGPDATTALVNLYADDSVYIEEDAPPVYSGVVADMRVGFSSVFTDTVWRPYASTLEIPVSQSSLEPIVLYAQYRDLAGNVSEVYNATLPVDTLAPTVSVQVPLADTPTRLLTIAAWDDLSGPATLYISNDPLMETDVVTLPYADTVTWTFDDRRVVWVQVEDAVGNRSAPYPAYAAEAAVNDRIYLPLIRR